MEKGWKGVNQDQDSHQEAHSGEFEPNTDQTAMWVEHLMEPSNATWCQALLGLLPSGTLRKRYIDYFAKHDRRCYMLVEKSPVKDITDQVVLGALERLRQKGPEVLKYLILEGLTHVLDLYQKHLQDLGDTQDNKTPPSHPAAIAIASWLYGVAQQPLVPAVQITLAQALLNTLNEAVPVDPTPKAEAAEEPSNLLKATKAKNRKLAEDNQQQQQRIRELEEQVGSLQAELTRVQQQLSQQEQQITQRLGETHRLDLEGLRKEHQAELQTLKLHHQSQLEQSRKERDDYWRPLNYQLDQELTTLRSRNKHLLEAKTDLQAQVDQLSSENETCERELDNARRFGRHHLTPDEAFAEALVLDYTALADNPRERLMALWEGYQLFLEGQSPPMWEGAADGLEMTEPGGILLLGLEHMLLDGINTPLLRYLQMATFRSEAILQRLVKNLESPRLKGVGHERQG